MHSSGPPCISLLPEVWQSVSGGHPVYIQGGPTRHVMSDNVGFPKFSLLSQNFTLKKDTSACHNCERWNQLTRFVLWIINGGGGGGGLPGGKNSIWGANAESKITMSSLPGWEAQRQCCNTLFVAVLNRKLSKTWFYLQQELREYPLQATTHNRHTPPPPINLLWEKLWQIMKQMSKTLNSNIDTPILNKRGSFEVPDPVKRPPYHAPPLLPLRCISRWCK